jgi:thiol:disulfide interchange protein
MSQMRKGILRRAGLVTSFLTLTAIIALPALAKTRQWMVRVKKALGIVMIIVSEYLLLQAGQRFV